MSRAAAIAGRASSVSSTRAASPGDRDDVVDGDARPVEMHGHGPTAVSPADAADVWLTI